MPTGGDVIRGTVNTRDATRSDIRERTSAVFQNFQRYQMTLGDNVVLADVARAEDEEAVIRALERGGVPAELWQGAEGLDLMLSREFGTRDLSLGQWQRVAIARGLFREHDVILLDEPTASIDPLEEQAVYERFMEIAAGRTAILVTHRLGLGTAGGPDPGDAGRPHRRGRHARAAAQTARALPRNVHRAGGLVQAAKLAPLSGGQGAGGTGSLTVNRWLVATSFQGLSHAARPFDLHGGDVLQIRSHAEVGDRLVLAQVVVAAAQHLHQAPIPARLHAG